MLQYVHAELKSIEDSINPNMTRSDLFVRLRSLGFSDFGELMISLPNATYPKISALLPRMASDEIQKNWTGSCGYILLNQSLDFVRSLSYNFGKYTGKSLEDSKVLDFGCGYGRIARLLYYFVDEENYFGVDPWNESIEICNDSGLVKNFLMSDYLPSELPVNNTKFDLIFAFSVFTHLSERATSTCLETLSRYVTSNGIIAITIRPVEYWDIDVHAQAKNLVEKQKELHGSVGFSFLPHNRDSVDGDITYGDTSMTVAWLTQNFPKLDVVGIDRSLNDAYQLYVFLKKK